MKNKSDLICGGLCFVTVAIMIIAIKESDSKREFSKIETVVHNIEIEQMVSPVNIELGTTEVIIEEVTEEIVAETAYDAGLEPSTSAPIYYEDTGVLTATKGINYFQGHKETYYNLPMEGIVQMARDLGIEGEYWVREDGCKMYGDYIMVAANLEIHPRGSLVETSLGTGIVLDTGGFASYDTEAIDIATGW